MSFNPDKFLEKYEKAPAESEDQGFNPDSFLAKYDEDNSTEPYYNPVEKGLMKAGGAIADSKVGKGLQWFEKNVTNPGKDAFLDALGVEGDGKRSFKELFEHEDGFFSRKQMSEMFPDLFSDKPEEYKKPLVWKKDGAFDQSPGSAMGNVADIVVDPLNAIPLGKAASLGGRGVKAAAGKADDLLRISERAGKIGGKVRKGVAKTGSALTGIPEQSIETYMSRMDEVDDLIKQTGGDMSLAADDMREAWQKGIRSKKSSLGAGVDDALSKSDDLVDLSPLQQKIKAAKESIDPITQADDLKEIMELESVVNNVAKRGNVSARDMNNIKKFFQERAKSSYVKDGKIFNPGASSKKFARTFGRDARKMTEKAAPEVGANNRQLALLHDLEQKMNNNLLAPGKAENSLVTAGAGIHSRNLRNLKRLSEAADIDMVSDAQKLAAGKEFANPALIARDVTGKSATRTGLAAGAGFMLGGTGGAAVTTALTSPAALKIALKTGKISSDVVKNLAGGAKAITAPVLERAVQAAKTPAGKKIIENSLRGGRSEIEKAYPDEVNSSRDKDSMYANNDMMRMVEKNPAVIDGITNPKLKQKLKEYVEGRPSFIKEKIDEQEARDQYVQGN